VAEVANFLGHRGARDATWPGAALYRYIILS
jgi:hypothetical protein